MRNKARLLRTCYCKNHLGLVMFALVADFPVRPEPLVSLVDVHESAVQGLIKVTTQKCHHLGVIQYVLWRGCATNV